MNCYIHIPFCTHICSYCDFPKICYLKKYTLKYLSALEKEIISRYKNEEINTLYIGGGTPSSLDMNELNILFRILKIFKKSKNIEFTFECNIENITLEKLKFLYDNGVNRLSFGVQTNNLKHLKFLNRYHNKEDVINVINMAKSIGFKNINVDLIYGIPNQTLSELKKDIDDFIKLDITHISTYSLIIENNTVLKNNNVKNIDEDLEYKFYLYINKTLKENNFIQYEISNYAKNGYYSLHNLNYWNNNSYYGFGLGAVSYINNYRYNNTRNINDYIKINYLLSKDYEDEKIKMSNELILGLRKINGVNKLDFKNKYNKNIEDVFNIDEMIKNKLLILENDNIKINSKYLYISNEILINFIL